MKGRPALAGIILVCAACIASAHPQQLKGGAKADINAIGNRAVAHGPNFYSVQREVALGRTLATQVDSNVSFVHDRLVSEYINRIGQNLVRNSDAQIPFTIKVIDSDDVNAFSLPGGFLYVDSGLVLFAHEESELAAAMAHEIAHVCARHSTRVVTQKTIVKLISVPLLLVGPAGWAGYALYAVPLGLPLSTLEFSRALEIEADFLGVQYMYKAGYDPNAMVALLEKVAVDRRAPGLMSRMLSDHPRSRSRILAAQKEIATILPARNDYIVTTSEFELVKEHLRSNGTTENKQLIYATRPVIRDRTNLRPSTDDESRHENRKE